MALGSETTPFRPDWLQKITEVHWNTGDLIVEFLSSIFVSSNGGTNATTSSVTLNVRLDNLFSPFTDAVGLAGTSAIFPVAVDGSIYATRSSPAGLATISPTPAINDFITVAEFLYYTNALQRRKANGDYYYNVAWGDRKQGKSGRVETFPNPPGPSAIPSELTAVVNGFVNLSSYRRDRPSLDFADVTFFVPKGTSTSGVADTRAEMRLYLGKLDAQGAPTTQLLGNVGDFGVTRTADYTLTGHVDMRAKTIT